MQITFELLVSLSVTELRLLKFLHTAKFKRLVIFHSNTAEHNAAHKLTDKGFITAVSIEEWSTTYTLSEKITC